MNLIYSVGSCSRPTTSRVWQWLATVGSNPSSPSPEMMYSIWGEGKDSGQGGNPTSWATCLSGLLTLRYVDYTFSTTLEWDVGQIIRFIWTYVVSQVPRRDGLVFGNWEHHNHMNEPGGMSGEIMVGVSVVWMMTESSRQVSAYKVGSTDCWCPADPTFDWIHPGTKLGQLVSCHLATVSTGTCVLPGTLVPSILVVSVLLPEESRLQSPSPSARWKGGKEGKSRAIRIWS